MPTSFFSLRANTRSLCVSLAAFWLLNPPLAISAQSSGGITPSAVSAAAMQAPGAAQTSAQTQRSTTTQERTARDSQRETDLQRDAIHADRQKPDALTEFQQMVKNSSGQRVPIFGANLFTVAPSTFAPVEDVPVGPGYIIGPGDELRIQLAGQVNEQVSLLVDRTGSIAIPEIGQVHVAGLPYSQLASYLRQQVGRVYRNFELSVNLGALRSIQVFVVGQARFPGSYTISSLSSLLNALFAAGGPLPQGSLRDIQVNRGGQVVTHFDLYDLLLHGDKSHDVGLATGDVIFIPVAGPQIAVLGSVTNPAIYELKGETTAKEAIALAGGETTVASGANVRLERVYDHAMRSLQEISLSGPDAPALRNGDILTVNTILGRFRDAVTLRGNVANPGRYSWHAGMRIGDLIPNKEALITREYWSRRNELGQNKPEYAPEQPELPQPLSRQRPYPPAQATPRTNTASNETTSTTRESGGNSQQETQTQTTEQTQNATELPFENQRPNTSTDSGSNSVGNALATTRTLFNPKNYIILSAPDIDWSYAVVERQSTTDLTTSLIPFNLGKLILDGDASQNLELQPGDVVTIFSKADLRVPTSQQTRFVRLEGEFAAPGIYSVLPGETLRGLLRRVGGLTGDAYLYASEFTRESTRRVEQQRIREYADQLEAQVSAVNLSVQARGGASVDPTAVANAAQARAAIARLRESTPIGRIVLDLKPNSSGVDSIPDLALEDGDRFVVPRVPSNVNVQGQVYNANAFLYAPGRRALDYLKQAGGPDREGDRKRSFVLRADGSVVSQQYANIGHAIIYPGDTIVIPPNFDKRPVLQRIVEISNILGQLGFAAAALNVLR